MVVGGREGREYQGHSHQVCSACMHKYATARGIWGHTPPHPKKCLKFRGYEIASENFWANTMIQHRNIYPFCPWRCTALVQLSDCSLASQATAFADEACETKIMEEQKDVGRKTQRSFLHCSQPSHKFEHVLGSLVWASAEQWH